MHRSSFKRLVDDSTTTNYITCAIDCCVVAMSSSSSRLKRSLSLDIGMDSDQPADDGFIPAISRKNRRRAVKKSKVCDHTDNGRPTDNHANLTSQDLSSNANIDVCSSKVQGDTRDMSLSLSNLAVIIAVV